MKESIIISGLAVPVHIGVPVEERADVQTVWVDLEITSKTRFAGMQDDVMNTIDYAAVAEAVVSMAAGRQWKLIETLATDICGLVLGRFGARGVKVQVRKKILPNADYVAVRTEAMATQESQEK